MGRCGCSSGNGGRGSSKTLAPEIRLFKPGWSLSGCVSVEYDPTWLSRPERFFNAITPPQIISELSLLRNHFDFYRRSGPIHRARGNRHPLVRGHEVFKGKHHDPLSEEVRVPFDEPNFPSIPKSFILVGTQNERDLRPNRSSAPELPMHC